MYKVLTIAGSDSGGGAGIQADLKTFSAFKVYGMSVLTAITAQNTCGVTGIEELSLDIIEKQLEAVLNDIGTDAVKTGMLANPGIVSLIADIIERYGLSNVVVDPVMIAKSGDALLSEDAVAAIKEKLIPLATVVTPNLPEAEAIAGVKIRTVKEMKEAAVEISGLGCKCVVVKGGHLCEEGRNGDLCEAVDIIYEGGKFTSLCERFIKSQNTHGTGCTFASAIAAGLAKGYLPLEAIKVAKSFITEAIRTAPNIGKGHGPVNHLIDSMTGW